MPSARLAEFSKELAKLDTVLVSQLQPELRPFRMPEQILLPTEAQLRLLTLLIALCKLLEIELFILLIPLLTEDFALLILLLIVDAMLENFEDVVLAMLVRALLAVDFMLLNPALAVLLMLDTLLLIVE